MITATNEDCMDLLKRTPDKYFELSIVDPPYGIGANKEKEHNGWKSYGVKEWDNKIPNKDYFAELFRVSRNQIVWGGNYMTEFLPPKMCWLMWDKGQRDFSLADGELAWTSFDKALRIFNMPRASAMKDAKDNGGKIHATQKPVKLYEWILMNYAKEGDKILDTHRGSASLDIACYNLGFDLVTCELDTDYFNDGNKRLKQHQQQLTIF